MCLQIGQVLRGQAASYQVTKVLKESCVFQARLVAGGGPSARGSAVPSPSSLAVIKVKPEGREGIPYDREKVYYDSEVITQSPYIRSRRDVIGHDEGQDGPQSSRQRPCMVFEWMDTDLWQLPSESFRSGSLLPKIVAKSALQALILFDRMDGVHNDLNPNNILVSHYLDLTPVVKVGDLGNLVRAGKQDKRYQGLHIRAPEVWRGMGMFHSCDVWSLGVTLAHWLASKVIFGPDGKFMEGMIDAWCLAKMIRLVGPLEGPVESAYDEEFAIAAYLEKGTVVHPTTNIEQPFVTLGTIREELEKVPGKKIDRGCIDFIESLLVVDHTKRPTAREALKHPWLQDTSLDDVD
ncbi:MAG: hypothetical protein M1817_005830 [Caeruleum heppii]|nr:MAG: hypothetical protein M1817_005830 [Caeruleum heppii]